MHDTTPHAAGASAPADRPEAERAIAELRTEVRALRRELLELREERERALIERRIAETAERIVTDQVGAMRRSNSWRITAPFRALRRSF